MPPVLERKNVIKFVLSKEINPTGFVLENHLTTMFGKQSVFKNKQTLLNKAYIKEMYFMAVVSDPLQSKFKANAYFLDFIWTYFFLFFVKIRAWKLE